MGSQLFPALFLVCVITGQTRGSLHLTTFPTRITEGNTYTLMCSSSAGSRNIEWSRNSALTLRTRYVSVSQCAVDEINPTTVNTFLSGRINTSCGFSQHNVTLRVSAQLDNGSVWWCEDNVKGDRSNNITVEVMTVPTTSSPTSVTSFIERSTRNTGSLRLTTFPPKSTEGNTYTLMCSSIAGSRNIEWSRNSALTVRTRYVSATQCAEDVVNPTTVNTFLSGRINTSCEFNQHNVTLMISAQLDSGSVWWCADNVKGDRSNSITIDVVNAEESTAASPVTLMTSPTASSESRTFVSEEVMTVPTTSPPTSVISFIERTTRNTEETPNVVYIVIGVIGGAVGGCVITAAVVIAWTKKRNIIREDTINTPNIYDSASHYEDMDHQYSSVEKHYVNTVEGTETDTPDYVNTDEDKRDTAYYNMT